jgi:hypothetical protein
MCWQWIGGSSEKLLKGKEVGMSVQELGYFSRGGSFQTLDIANKTAAPDFAGEPRGTPRRQVIAALSGEDVTFFCNIWATPTVRGDKAIGNFPTWRTLS